MKMLEIFESLKNALSYITNRHSENSPRKRRLSHDIDNFPSKMRRFESFQMPRCSSPLDDLDTPSTSKNVFKKPYYPSSKPFLRPNEVLDLSDDEEPEFRPKKYDSSHSSNEDWTEVQVKKGDYWGKSNFFNRFKSQNEQRHRNVLQNEQIHRNVLQKAKNTLAKNNLSRFNYKKQSSLNESINLAERKKYQVMLETFAKSSKLFPNGTSKKEEKEKPMTFTEIYKKRFNDAFVPKVIDLTSENENKTKTISIDSDSDSDIKIVSHQKAVSPVNSLKKRLEIEPVTSEKWIKEWDSNYVRKLEEKRQQIEECKQKADKFRDINKQNVQYRLEESLKNCLRLQEVVILDEPEEKLTLPELTESQERIIANALRPGPGQQVFIDKFNLRVTRADLQTLKGLNWLNDEVINFYTNLISDRGNGKNPKLPKVHSMNTFFYPKLVSQGYNTLRRWTKKIDIFAQDLIVVPVHLGVHWCLSIIDFRDKTIKYYDSMGSPNPQCLKALLEYLKAEHLDKKKSEFDASSWKTFSVRDIPQQMNGSDCGMFACMYAEFITRNAKILFTQEHMPYFRKKMIYEIISGELMMK